MAEKSNSLTRSGLMDELAKEQEKIKEFEKKYFHNEAMQESHHFYTWIKGEETRLLKVTENEKYAVLKERDELQVKIKEYWPLNN